MFGYIIPVIPEMKVKDHELFKECYCGLCHVLGRRCGFISRMLLNYDFVFLAMLLWEKDTPVETDKKRCIGCPHKKKKYCRQTREYDAAASLSVILSWWKCCDSVEDEKGIKRLGYKIAAAALKKSYRNAAKEYPYFDKAVEQGILELSKLENENCDSIDRTADCFAKILAAAAKITDGTRKRILEEILYHIGRWIYIVDACDDLEEDLKENRYNPVRIRFDLGNKPDDQTRERLLTTLMHSRNLAGNSFELLEENPYSEIIRNIIYYGMPLVADAVLSGEWRKINGKIHK